MTSTATLASPARSRRNRTARGGAEVGPVVIVDTREQKPYHFGSSVVKTLPTGDYSIVGMESRIAIERKTKADAYSSLGMDRPRFLREIERLAEFEYGAVVIEAALKDFLVAPAFTRLHPRSAVSSLLAWSVKYGVHVFFAGDRRHGNAVTAQLLEKFWRYRGVAA
jgi:DNA excision repair protein ERCC-4